MHQTSSPQTKLHQAVMCKDLFLVISALADGADPNLSAEEEDDSLSPMDQAVCKDFIAGLETMVRFGGDVGRRDSHDGTLLFTAAITGALAAGRWLISRGVDVGVVNKRGQTALQRALECNEVDFASMLCLECPSVGEGGELDRVAKALMSFRMARVVSWLLDHGVNANLVGDKGCSWLMVAQERDDEVGQKMTRMLLSAGANVHHQDDNGETALHKAARVSAQSLIPLLRAGADPDLPSHDGSTARMLLKQHGSEDLRIEFQVWEASQRAQEILAAKSPSTGLKPL